MLYFLVFHLLNVSRGGFLLYLMAKRRMISNEINYDEHFNSLSVEGQLLFIRLLTISDDCGVVPANEYTLNALLNLPSKISKSLKNYIEEIINQGLLVILVHDGKMFYCFKGNSFDTQQAYIIKNRTKSEYLKISIGEFNEVYNNQTVIKSLQEFTVNYSNFLQTGSYHIESNKHKAISKKQEREKAGISLFRNSEYFDFDKFRERFNSNPDYQKYDAKYYYESALNWSDANNKKKADWIATVYNWCRRDVSENKPHLYKEKRIELK